MFVNFRASKPAKSTAIFIINFCPPMQLAPYVTDYFPESFETVGEYVCHFWTVCVCDITSSRIYSVHH